MGGDGGEKTVTKKHCMKQFFIYKYLFNKFIF